MSAKPYLACIVLMLSCISINAEPLNVGDRAPNWTLNNADGSRVSLYSDAGGQPVVLLFWATWCPFCRALMPELESLKQELDNRYRFYALNIFEDSDPVAHMRENNYTFTLLVDADPVAADYGVTGTPGVIVVSADKQVLYSRKSGSKPDAVRAAVKSALLSGDGS